jgi:alpha/beta superfamily hydrolase
MMGFSFGGAVALIVAGAIPGLAHLSAYCRNRTDFKFVDPCPPSLEAEAPAICKDADGANRVAVHQRIEAEIATFLQKNM